MNEMSDPVEDLEEVGQSTRPYWYFEKGAPFRASITGTVEPIEWNEFDEVTRVCIYVEEEETEYEVADNARGKQLLQMIGARIKARGIIDHLYRDVYEIRVAEFEPS